MKKILYLLLLATTGAFAQSTTTLPTPTTAYTPQFRYYGNAIDSLKQIWLYSGSKYNRMYTATEIKKLYGNSFNQKIDSILSAPNIWTNTQTFNGQFVAGQTMFNNVSGSGQLNNDFQFDLGNGVRVLNGNRVQFYNSANSYKHYFQEIGTSLYLINDGNTNSVRFTNDGNIIDASGNAFLKQGSAGSDTSVSNNYVAKMPNKFGANITGTGGNGFVQLPSQSVSPASSTGNLRIYSDSLNRFSWKNSQHRRTIRVNRPIDQTITMPYRQNPIVADSTDVVSTYQTKMYINVADYGVKADSLTDNLTALRALAANPITNHATIYFPGGKGYLLSDSVVWQYPVKILGAGGRAPYVGTTGTAPTTGLYKGGNSIIVQTGANKTAFVINRDGSTMDGLTIKNAGGTPTAGEGVRIQHGNMFTMTNTYVGDFFTNVHIVDGLDMMFHHNQFANPIGYNVLMEGTNDDEGNNEFSNNIFNASVSGTATSFKGTYVAGLRFYGNDMHIASGQLGTNPIGSSWVLYDIDLDIKTNTSAVFIENNLLEAYQNAAIRMRLNGSTSAMNKVHISGNTISNSGNGAFRDIDIYSPSTARFKGLDITGNHFANVAPRASIYIENVSGLSIGPNTFNDASTSKMDSLVNCVNAFSPFNTDIYATKRIFGGALVTSALNLQGTTANGTPTVQAINFNVGNNGGTLAGTFLNSGFFGLGTNVPKSTLSVNGGVGIGTYAGVNGISTGNVALSGKISVGTTLTSATFNTANASGTDIFRSYLNVDGTLYHSIQDNFSATATGSYRLFSIGTGTANTTTPVLRLTGNGNAYFGANTIPTARVHIAAGTATASTAPLKLTSGVSSQTTVEQGAVNFDGTRVYVGSTATPVNQTVAYLSDVNSGTNYLSKSANYTVLTSDFGNGGALILYVDATAGVVTITLPSATTFATGGKSLELVVFKTDSSGNGVNISGSANINGSATYTVTPQFASVRIVGNGTQYYAK